MVEGTDEFTYEVKRDRNYEQLTKRIVLGEIARLYDPNGFIAPVIARAKMLMQNIWSLNLDWDVQLSNHIVQEWNLIWAKIKCLEEIRIQRWLKYELKEQIQIHGFSDASQKAYGAVIYIRAIDAKGNIHVNLLISKSKIAPTQQLTIPRLELMAADLLSKLVKVVQSAMQLENASYYLWSDSTITLQWLRKPISDLKISIANRVRRIKENSAIEHWHHIRTDDNPADLVSRGLLANEIVNNSLWWKGPSWLSKEQKDWPEQIQITKLKPSTEMKMELRGSNRYSAKERGSTENKDSKF